MGFLGSGDKVTSTNATQTGVSDDGMNIAAGGAGGKDHSVNVAGGGLFSTTKVGSTEVGTIASNSLLNSTNSGTINFGLGTADVGKLLSDTTSGISGLVKQQTDAAKSQVTDVVAGLQDLALNKQTNGESNRDKTILYVVGLGVLGLLSFIYARH